MGGFSLIFAMFGCFNMTGEMYKDTLLSGGAVSMASCSGVNSLFTPKRKNIDIQRCRDVQVTRLHTTACEWHRYHYTPREAR